RAELTDAEIAHRLASHKVERTRIGSDTVTLSATPAVVNLQAELGDGEVGTIHGRIDAQRITAGAGSPVESLAHWPDMPLSGELHAQTAELGLLSLYVPDIDRASGHFNADIQLAGTAGSPRLAGAVRLSEGSIDVYPDLDFSVAGRRIEVSGKVTVPFAKIQPRNLADAVRASPDEVIVGSEVEDPAKRFEAMSAITLVLGDKVNIDTSGLTGRLT